jgi:protein ImuA
MILPIPHRNNLAGPAHGALALPGGLGPEMALARGRVHEFCGPSRVMLAILTLAGTQGPVVWAFPGWQAERLNAPGIAPYFNPARLILVRARRAEDILWTAEEVLRSGAVPVMVAELVDLPGLTPIRRLQLAAEAGAEAARNRGQIAPIGLLLTPDAGREPGSGAPGVDSRWHLVPAPSTGVMAGDSPAWTLTRQRARMAAPGVWALHQESRDMAEGVGQRPEAPRIRVTPRP